MNVLREKIATLEIVSRRLGGRLEGQFRPAKETLMLDGK